MSSFRVHTITGIRFATGTREKGRYVPGADSPIEFKASVQPLSGHEKLTLPEGIREKSAYRLYTSFQLYTSQEDDDKKADRVTLFDDVYEIIRVDVWQNQVIPHYKAIASLIDA
jgi:hypothetical protein